MDLPNTFAWVVSIHLLILNQITQRSFRSHSTWANQYSTITRFFCLILLSLRMYWSLYSSSPLPLVLLSVYWGRFRGLSMSMHLLISVASLSWMEVNFLKPKSMYTTEARGFPVWYFVLIECVSVYVHLRTFFEHSQLCFHVVYPFSLFIMIFPFLYLAPKSSGLFPIWLLVCLHSFSPYL